MKISMKISIELEWDCMSSEIITLNMAPDDELEQPLPVSEGVRVVVLLVGSLLCVTGVFGNVLILVTLVTQRSLRSLHHIYVGNLAVSDLFIMAYILPCWLVDVAMDQRSNSMNCKVVAFLSLMCTFFSLYSLVFISFNRFLSVYQPHRYGQFFSKRTTFMLIFTTWLLPAILCAVPLFTGEEGQLTYNRHARLCTYDFRSGSVSYFAVLCALNFLLCMLLAGVFCLAIFKAWKRNRALILPSTQHNSENSVTGVDPTVQVHVIAVQPQPPGRAHGDTNVGL
jgi:hypothetical protein